MSIDSEILMKAPKCRDKFFRRIYLHSICKQENKATQIPEIYVKNPQREKTMVTREIPLIREITMSFQHSIIDLIS